MTSDSAKSSEPAAPAAVLTREQEAAVKAGPWGAFLISAGPGTGKTFTMVERFLWLVGQQRVKPEQIFVVTFMEKAATELRERISAALGKEGRTQAAEAMDGAWVGTFHSLCSRILQENAYLVGMPPEMKVLDNVEQAMMLRELQAELRSGAVGGINLESLVALGPDEVSDLIRHGLQFVRKLKGRGIGPQEFRERALELHTGHIHPEDPEDLAAIAEVEAVEILHTIYSLYQQRLHEAGRHDFDDLILGTIKALTELPELRDRCRARFRYLLVDEFQDSNRIQLELVRLLAADDFQNTTVVGDAKQSIYGWRDAEIENIRTRFPGRTLPLTHNRRSFQQILDCATSLIRRDPDFASEPELVAERGRGGPGTVTVMMARDAGEEAVLLADQIAKLRTQDPPLAYSRMAILAHSVVHLPPEFEQELRLRQIPYLTSAGAGLFDREEVKDVLAMLRLVEDPLADGALSRVLGGPLVRVPDSTLYPIAIQRLNQRGVRLRDCLELADGVALDSATAERAQRLLGTLDGLGEVRDAMTISDLLNQVLQATGYLRHCELRALTEGPRAILNLRKVALMASQFEQGRGLSNLGDFVRHLDQVFESELGLAEAGEPTTDAVALLTIHGSKGLEYDAVFLVNTRPPMVRDSERLFFESEGLGFVMKYWRGEKHPRFLATAPSTQALQLARDERRRSVYVALTRARDRLFISATREEAAPDAIEVRPEAADHFSEIVSWALAQPDSGFVLPGKQEGLPFALPVPPQRSVADQRRLADLIDRVEILAEAETNTVALPAPAVRLSFSHLHTFEICPVRYELSEVLGLPTIADELLARPARRGGSKLGSAIHAALGAWHRSQGGDLLDIFDGLAEPYAITDQEMKDGRAMMNLYLAHPLSTAPTLGVEVEFNLRLEGVELRGFVDRICELDGRSWLLDYKTNRDAGRVLLNTYSTQLRLYEVAAKEGLLPGGPTPVLSLFRLRTGDAIRVESNPNDARARVGRAVAAIRSGRFELGPEHADRPCFTCSYSPICSQSRT